MWAIGAGIALAMQTGHAWQQSAAQQVAAINPLTSCYRTKDERWIYLSCLQGFHYWPDACRVLGVEELITDPRFATHEDLMANGREAAAILQQIFRSHTVDEWRERLSDFRGQWAVVQDALEVTERPAGTGERLHPRRSDGGRERTSRSSPRRCSSTANRPRQRVPRTSTSTATQILTDLLGYDWDTVVELKVKGAVESTGTGGLP